MNAAEPGELHYGHGIHETDFIYLTFGTGNGGAIVMNNMLLSAH